MRDGALWISGGGPDSDIVVSSRVRLARNLVGMPFPNRSDASQLQQAREKVIQAAKSTPSIGPLEILLLEDMSEMDRRIAVEEHLTSPQHVSEPKGRALILNRDNSLCVMVNEEDHLRIQAILPGFQLEQALRLAWAADDAIEETLDYAFDSELGYLSACPTNVGTGMRASVMLHLPALVITNSVGQVLGAASKVGVATRGIYGEGTEAVGNLFQVSNQVTMGRAEEEIIAHLGAIVRQIIDSERSARRALLDDARPQIEDRLYRSFGILTNARMMPSEEALKLMSDVKLGADMGILPNVPDDLLTRLSVDTMPAHVQRALGRELSVWERDIARAGIIRERFEKANKASRGSNSAPDMEE